MLHGLVFRPLRNDWSRSLLSVLAVALGVGVVVAIRVANRSALASFSQSTHSLSAGAQLLVTGPAPLDAALLARLRPLTAQAEFTPYLDRRAYNPADGATLEVLGLDLVAAAGRQPGSQPLSATARSRESRRLHGGQSRREGLPKSGGVKAPVALSPLPANEAARPPLQRRINVGVAKLAAFRPAPPPVGRVADPRAGRRPAPPFECEPGAASVSAEQGQGPAPGKRSGMPGIAGQGPAPINAGLWLSAAYAARRNLRPGSTVALVIGGVSHTFPVAGLLPPSAAQPADFALLDLPAALQAFEPGASPSGMPGIAGQGPAPVNFDGLRVRLAPGVNAQAIAAAIQPLLPPPDTVVTPRARTLGQERMLAAFRANLEALAYVSLLVGVFLIYNTVSISVVRRREQTATLRALGATRGQLLRLFLTEGAVLSLAGAAVGLGFGWALAAGALSLMQRTINSLYAAVQPAHASLQPWDVAWALGLGLAAGLLAAWAPARAAAGIAPAQALRPGSAEQSLRHHRAATLGAAGALALLALVLARLPEPSGGVPWFGFASALAAVLAWTALTPALLAALLPRLRAALLARRRLAARGARGTATPGPAPGQSGARGAAVQGPAPTNARGAAALRPAPSQSGARGAAAQGPAPTNARGTAAQGPAPTNARGIAALGIAPTFALAAGALAGALRRSSVLTAALATAIGVMLGVAIMVGSFRQTVALWLGQQLQATVFVRPADWDRNHPVPIAPALAARLLATPAAGAIEADHLQRWLFRGQPVLIDTHWAAAGVGAPPQQRFLAGGAGPVIVSEPFARRFHLWAGDPIPLTGPRGALNARIAGVFYDYTSSQGEIVLAPASFRQAFGPPAITELGFDPASGVAATALEAAINRRLLGRTGMVVTNNQQLRTAAMRVFDQTFQITYALEVITLLVAVLGVANTLLAVVLERGKELAILRALGAVRRQLRHLLLAEAALIATLALALGWGVGITLAWILVRVINVQSFGWTILWHWPWLYLVLASALVWLATLAAGWVPARTAERTIAPALLESE